MSIVALEISRQDVKRINRRMVLSEIILNGPVSRSEIARRTGLTNATVSRVSREFIRAGLVSEGNSLPAPKRPGRRFIALDVNPAGGYVLGISINVFQQFITLADIKNRAVARRELKLASFDDPDRVLAEVAAAASEIIKEAKVPQERILGGSVAITGAVDPVAGTIRSAPPLGWKRVPIGALLSRALGIPIHVESLPNAINLAEARFGRARGLNNVVLFNASLGIGTSLLLDGQLIRGNDFSAGLIGDLSLWRDKHGKRLAVDEVAGGWGVLRPDGVKRREITYSVPLTRKLFATMEAARIGDAKARDALASAGRSLGRVIELVAGITHPELVIVAGPLAGCRTYMAAAQEALAEAWPKAAQRIPLHASDMTWRAAARWLAINEFLLRRDIDLERLVERSAA